MPRIVRLLAVALALVAQLPSLLAAAGACGVASATVASAQAQGAAHDSHPSPAGDHGHGDRSHPSRGHQSAHCAMVSTCAMGCVGERMAVAGRSLAPRVEPRLAFEVRVPDSPLVSPEPPPPRG